MALQLGFAHPDIMLAQMTSAQFTEWMAYAGIEPFGEFRAELRNGTLCSLLANVNRDTNATPDPYNASDFMHFVDTHEKPERNEIPPEEAQKRIDREVFGLGG